MTVKIFCIYHKLYEIFKSDVIEPIQTGCFFSDVDLGFLKDNSEINIAEKNKNYGELTAWYWVWKNYLDKCKNIKYIGFCHYRRFLDFDKPEKRKPFTNKADCKKFKVNFNENYSLDKIQKVVEKYDIVLPAKSFFSKNMSIYKQYIKMHPKDELDKLMNIVNEKYPEYVQDMNMYFNGNSSYFCLNFVMKKELFVEFLVWIFDILNELERISDWCEYQDYSSIRTPAYLAERFFNVWLLHKIRTSNIKILERKSILLCDFYISFLNLFSIAKNNNRLEFKFIFFKCFIKI